MNRKYILVASVLLAVSGAASFAAAEDELTELTCTSILVGKDASADGSLITSHTCDGHYRTWFTMESAADHPSGALHKIYKGSPKTSGPDDTAPLKMVLTIPEAAHTYKYINTGYPCLNECNVAIGETTFGGPDTLRNPDSPLMIEELERIALQRCSTAREAVLMMGQTAQKYGYGDGGECLTVVDKSEAWFFEIIGVGRKAKGAAWVAVRIPDDHVAVSANIPRIGRIDRSDKSSCLCSDNLEAVALEHGLWDGVTPFSFWRAFHDSYGDGRNYSYREFFILSNLAPSLGLKWGMDELPLSVKPDKKVDVKRVFELLGSTYEGTDWDVSRNMLFTDKDGTVRRNPAANPWITAEVINMLNSLKKGAAVSHRTPSVVWCAYSHVIQIDGSLPEGLGGTCWMSVDNPAQSPRVPIFSGSTDVPEPYKLCGQDIYRPDCALWQFRRANRLSLVRWTANKDSFLEQRRALESESFRRLDSLKASWSTRPEDLDKFTLESYERAASKWNDLEAKYWLSIWRGL